MKLANGRKPSNEEIIDANKHISSRPAFTARNYFAIMHEIRK